MVITRQLTDSASASTASNIQLGSCVTEIGQGAFSGYTNITEVEFPDSLTTIDDGAFSGSSITTVEIPSGVASIGVNAFKDCSNLDRVDINATIPPTLGSDAFNNTSNCPIYVPVTSYNDYKTAEDWVEYASRIRYEGAPYKVKFIDTNGEEIFINCDSSSSVSKPSPMPSGILTTIFGECIEEIGDFSNSTLGDVFISNSVKTIGTNAFWNSTVNSISFSEALETIGSSAFRNCSSLTSINIPSGVTSIGSNAFNGCSGLTSINIPNSVINIGSSAFYLCSKLSSITVNRATPPTLGSDAFNYTSNCPIYVPQESFNLYISAENWSVYESRITYIGEVYKLKYNTTNSEYGFVRCNDSTILVYTEIKGSISSADIGSCVTSIGDDAFYSHSNLTSITIPDTVTTIGNSAFYSCDKLTSVTIPNSVTSIGSSAFGDTPWWNTYSADTSNQYGNIIYINDVAYRAVSTAITSCTFREATVSISNYAFYFCDKLTSVTIPNRVTSIGNNAFYGCRSLTNVTIGNGVASIGTDAFYNCDKLTSVTIGNSVTSISNYAFHFCDKLTSVTVLAETPPTLGFDVFAQTNDCPIYVPSASVDAYKSATNWSSYASRIQAIPNS